MIQLIKIFSLIALLPVVIGVKYFEAYYEQHKVETKLSNQEAVEVTFCDLIAQPHKYNDKLIRFRATYFTDSHVGTLYDFRCVTSDKLILFKLVCATSEACSEMREKLEENLTGSILWKRAQVEAIGKYVERVNASENNAPNDKQRLLEQHTIEVVKIISTGKVPQKTPWPMSKK